MTPPDPPSPAPSQPTGLPPKEGLDAAEKPLGPPTELSDEPPEGAETNDDLPPAYPHPNRRYERLQSQLLPKGKRPEDVWQKEGSEEDHFVTFPHLNETHEPPQSVLMPKKRTLGAIFSERLRSMFRPQPDLGRSATGSQRRPGRDRISKPDKVKPSQELINKLDKAGLRRHSYRDAS